MVLLDKGNYLGLQDYSFNANILSAAVTHYPDSLNAGCWHAHASFVMSMVLKGGNLEKRKNKEIQRVSGVVTYLDAGTLHQNDCIVAGSRHVHLEVSTEFMKQYGVSISAETLEKHDPVQARLLLLKIYKELLLLDTETRLNIESAVLELCQPFRIKTMNCAVPGWVSKIKEVLYAKWNETITLNELGLIAGLHPVNLSAYFPRYFGCTIGDYKRKIKINEAVKLLRRNELNLTQISYECGFADQSHFTKVFTELTGWPPKKLRSHLK